MYPRYPCFVEPTNRCNLKCFACNRSPSGNEDLDVETFDRMLKTMFRQNGNRCNGEFMNLYWRGEPTLNNDLPRLSELAKGAHYRPYISTNTATKNMRDEDYVKELLKHCYRLEFCIDGYNQETLSTYREGARWEHVIDILRIVSTIDTECIKGMRVLMFKYNEGHEDFFKELAIESNMDKLQFGLPVVSKGQYPTQRQIDVYLPTDPKYLRYECVGKGRWKHITNKSCGMLPIIVPNGDVAMCCYDWNMEYKLGNIFVDSISKMHRRMKLLRIRKAIGGVHICNTVCHNPGVRVNYEVEI